MALRVTCINKMGGNHTDPHHAIEFLGWMEGTEEKKCTREAMYEWLKKTEANKAYVQDAAGNVAFLAARIGPTGNKYVQTHADGKWTDNLLALHECGQLKKVQ